MSEAMENRKLDIISYDKFLKLTPRQKKDCILINEVKRFKFLYDITDMNYKRPKFRYQAWEEIGIQLGMDGVDCMNRWKLLREKYRKAFKKTQMFSKTATVGKRKKWIYQDMMNYLDPYLGDIKSIKEDSGNDEDEEEIEVNLELSEDSSQPSYTLVKTDLENPLNNSLQEPQAIGDSGNVQLIRILVPPPVPDLKTVPKVPIKRGPKKYVKILPKTEEPTVKVAVNSNDQPSNDESGIFSKNSDQLDTVDHLMSFMGNTIKQLPLKKQIKISQDLTSAFFDIISCAEEDDDDIA